MLLLPNEASIVINLSDENKTFSIFAPRVSAEMSFVMVSKVQKTIGQIRKTKQSQRDQNGPLETKNSKKQLTRMLFYT